MLYSNWDTSVWYCYWSDIVVDKLYKLPTGGLKNSQVFEIYDIRSYSVTYGKIKKYGIDKIINEINEFYSKEYDGSGLIWNPNTCKSEYQESIYPAKNPTSNDIDELKKYLIQFMNDVDKSFKLYSFFKLYWFSSLNTYFKNKRLWI